MTAGHTTASVAALLRVTPPSERPALAAIAFEAQSLLADACARLTTEERGRFEQVPLESAIQAAGSRRTGMAHGKLPGGLRRLEARIRSMAGADSVAMYGRLLVLAELARVDRATPQLRIPEIAWHEIEPGLRLLLDAAPNIAPKTWDAPAFLNDLRAAQLAWLPCDNQVVVAARVRPWNVARDAPMIERLRLVPYLGRDTFRSVTVIESHAWRGFRERRREPWEVRSRRLAAIAAVNPSIVSTFTNSWLNDPALKRMSPRLTEKAEGTLRAGAIRISSGSSALSTAQALAQSETRRRLYDQGSYVPRRYAIFWRRSALLRWAKSQWEEAACLQG